jgi:hypothetical protein
MFLESLKIFKITEQKGVNTPQLLHYISWSVIIEVSFIGNIVTANVIQYIYFYLRHNTTLYE